MSLTDALTFLLHDTAPFFLVPALLALSISPALGLSRFNRSQLAGIYALVAPIPYGALTSPIICDVSARGYGYARLIYELRDRFTWGVTLAFAVAFALSRIRLSTRPVPWTRVLLLVYVGLLVRNVLPLLPA